MAAARTPTTSLSSSESLIAAMEDVSPPAFFLSTTAYTAVFTKVLDVEFHVQRGKWALARTEFVKAARAMDNIAVIQKTGWYFVLDGLFNGVCIKAGLQANFDRETELRFEVQRALYKGEDDVRRAVDAWKKNLYQLVEHERGVLMPMEAKLRPEVTTEILANGGNDWEWLLTFILSQLESHRMSHELGVFVMQLQAAVNRGSEVQKDRILPLVKQGVSPAMYQRLVRLGFRDESAAALSKPEKRGLLSLASRKASFVHDDIERVVSRSGSVGSSTVRSSRVLAFSRVASSDSAGHSDVRR